MIRLAVAALVLALAPATAHAQPAETPITAPGPEGALAGTLIAPAPGQPVLIFIPGSGPTDRDGNSPLGIVTGSYRQLMHALAARGIGSVRVDKRGMFASRSAGDANAVTIAGYAADMRSWIGATRTATGAPCVWLGGHSEGGLVALYTAAENPDGICGVVTIAAPGRRLGDVLRMQLAAGLAGTPLLEQAISLRAQLEAGERVGATEIPLPLNSLFNPAVQPFLIDLLSHDPAAIAARLTVPLLVVQGDADLQTTVEDAQLIFGTRGSARLAIIPGVNHALVAVPADDRAANIRTYGDATARIDPRIADVVAGALLATN